MTPNDFVQQLLECGSLPKKSTEVIAWIIGARGPDPELSMLVVALDRDGDGDDVPVGFVWNGATVKWLSRLIFPKWRHPKATCGHDYDCDRAKTMAERLSADRRFRRTIKKTQTKRAAVEAFVGYAGVRIGAYWGLVRGSLSFQNDAMENAK